MAKPTRETVSQYFSSATRRRIKGTGSIGATSKKYRKGPGIEVLKTRLSATYAFSTDFTSTFSYMGGDSNAPYNHLDALNGSEGSHANLLLPVGLPFTALSHSQGETHEPPVETAGGKRRSVFSVIDVNRNEESALRRLKNEFKMRDVIPLLAYCYATGSFVCSNSLHCKEREVEIYCIGLLESRKKKFRRCSCDHWAGRLIAHGYFPVGPGDVLTAVSFDLLDMFQCFSTNGAFSKEGYAKGLEEFHFLRLRQEPRNYIEHFRLCIPFWLRTRRKRDSLVHNALNTWIERIEQTQEATQIENEDEGVADTDPTTAPGRPIRFKTGSLVDLCPACFYRLSDRPEDSSPTIIAADGNFQQNRLKHVGYKNLDWYETLMFIHMSKKERSSVDNSLPEASGDCSHHFKASTKPYTMRHYDETGLISLVCRHDIPLRFLNMYAGERLGWIVFTLKGFLCLLREEIKEEDIILLYDIACQFGPHLRKHEYTKDLKDFIRVAVNKFHGFAHEYKCSQLWGTHQTPGVGDSDGEGCERVWALLKTIVHSGRDSTKANRQLFIENVSLAIAKRKRQHLGPSILQRFSRTTSRLRALQTNLRTLLKKTVDVTETDEHGKKTTITLPITEELLRTEREVQRKYFGSSSSAFTSRPSIKVYEKLSIERDLLRRRKKYEAENDPSSPGYAWGMVAEGIDDASKETVTARTDAELTAQNQTRDQWEENGERWQLSERRDPKKNPEYVLYLALKAERDKENVLNALEAKKKEREDEEREEQESRTRKPKQKGRRRKAKGKVQDAEGNNDEEEAATEEGKTKPKKKKKKPLTAAEKIAVERKEKENIEKATRDFEVAREAATRAFSKQNASKTAPEWAPVNGDDCGTTWARYFCYDVVAKLESYYQRLLFLAAQRNLEYRELRGRARGLKEAESILSAIHSKYPAMQTVITNFNETALSLPTRLRPPTLKLDAFKGVDPWDEEQIVTETGDGTAESSRDALFALHLTRTEIINPQSVPSSAWAVSNDVRMGILYQLKIDRSEEELVLLKKEWDRNVLHTSKVIGVLLDTLAPAENNSCAIFRPSIIRMLWDELLRAKLIVGSRAKANIFLSAEKMKDHHDAINISQFSCGDLPELLEKGRSVCEQHQLVFSTRGSPSPRNAVSVKYSAPTGPNMPAHSNDGVIGSDTYINGLLTEGFAGLQMEALHSEGGDGGIFADFADIFAQNESEDTNAGADVTEEGDEGYDEGSDGESSQGDGSEGDDSEGDGESQYAHENEVDDDVDEVMGEQ